MQPDSPAVAGRENDANQSSKDEQNVDTHIFQDERSLFLFKAIRKSRGGGEAALKLLLNEGGIDLNIKDSEGYTPLSRAVVRGRRSVVQLLVDHDGIVPDCKDQDGRTPLSRAAEIGHVRITQLLLEQTQVDPDAKDDNERTSLSYAAENGHVEIVKLLLDSGRVNADWKDLDGLTALARAARCDKTKVMKVMFDYGGTDYDSVDNDGQNILSQAVERGCEEVTKLLLKRRIINPNHEDVDGQTAIFRIIKKPWATDVATHVPTSNGTWRKKYFDENIPLLLLKHGADLNKKDNDGQTVFSRAAEFGHKEAIIWLSKQKKIDINTTDNQHRTPLWWAAEGRHGEIVVILLGMHDIDVDISDKNGHTPLSRAARHGHTDAVQIILGKDRATLHLHTRRGDLDLVTRLTEARYNLNTRDSLCRTPLHIAVLFGQLEIAKHLARAKRDIDAQDISGMTPLRFAVKYKHTEIVNVLLGRSADTTGISSEMWFDLYNKSKAPDSILELLEAPSGRKTISVINQNQIQTLLDSESTRRLLLYSNSSTWESSLQLDVRERLDLQKTRWVSHLERYTQSVKYFMAAWIPVHNNHASTNVFSICDGKCYVAWTIVPPVESKNGLSWKSMDHWSTLSCGWIPNSGTDFFSSFIQTVKGKWLAVCALAQDHLSNRRVDQLRGKGQDPGIIYHLAEDAQLWAELRRVLKIQIREARRFSDEYTSVYDQDNDSDVMKTAIDGFATEVGDQISELEQTGKELLQFEFAWVSINEAHRSTSIATSIKRLSWITFIFLPAMFASSLFGMNVNILASNPDWRWYLLFGGGFVALTGFGWLLFKYGKVEPWIEQHIGARLQRWSDGDMQRKAKFMRDP